MARFTNLLTPAQQTSTAVGVAWTAGADTTAKRTTKQFKYGPAALALTYTGSGVGHATVTSTPTVNITPSTQFRVFAWAHSRNPIQTVRVGVQFYDINGVAFPERQRSVFSGGIATSTSSVAIGTGSKTFSTQVDAGFVTGQRVRAADNANTANFVEGTVTSYNATTLVVDVDSVNGSGTKSSWLIGSATTVLDWVEKDIFFAQWTLVGGYVTAPENAYKAAVVLEARSLDPSTDNLEVDFDDVVLFPWAFPDNQFLSLAKDYLPEYLVEADARQSGPDFPLLRYFDLISFDADRAYRAYNAFEYVSEADGGPPGDTSTLVDPAAYPQPDVAEYRFLPWLAQHVGAKLFRVAGGQTPWYYLEGYNTAAGGYEGWDRWQTAINEATTPSFALSSIARTGNVVTATATGDQTALVPGSYATIMVTGVSDAGFNGTFTLTSASAAGGVTTLTWAQDGDNVASIANSGTVVVPDSTWYAIEQDNPFPLDPNVVLQGIVRTGATGLRSGTQEGMRRAVQLVLDGRDLAVGYESDGATVTFTTTSPHGLAVDDVLFVYDADDPRLNGRIEVASVATTTTFTAAVTSTAGSGSCWVTTRRVGFAQGRFVTTATSVTVSDTTTLSVVGDQPFPLSGSTGAPAIAGDTKQVTISGTGVAGLDETFTFTGVTYSADRYTATLTGCSPTPTGGPAAGTATFVADLFCWTVQTLTAQTLSSTMCVDAARAAAALGMVLTHEPNENL